MSSHQLRQPYLIVPIHVQQKLRAYATTIPNTEVSGFGLIELDEDQPEEIVYLTDVMLVKHKSNATLAKVDENDIAALMFELKQQGVDTSMLRVQWHSHVGNAYFSQTDMQANDVPTGEWMIHMVVNRYGDIVARMDMYQPFRLGLPMEVLKVSLPINDDLQAQCDEEVRAKRSVLVEPKTSMARNVQRLLVGEAPGDEDIELISLEEEPELVNG